MRRIAFVLDTWNWSNCFKLDWQGKCYLDAIVTLLSLQVQCVWLKWLMPFCSQEETDAFFRLLRELFFRTIWLYPSTIIMFAPVYELRVRIVSLKKKMFYWDELYRLSCRATHEASALVKRCFVPQAIVMRCVVFFFFDYDFLLL